MIEATKKFAIVIIFLLCFGLMCNTNDTYLPWANLCGVLFLELTVLIGGKHGLFD